MDRFTLVACGAPIAAVLSVPAVFSGAFVLFSAMIEDEHRAGVRLSTDGDVATIPAIDVTLGWVILLALGVTVAFVRARSNRRACGRTGTSDERLVSMLARR